MMGASKPICTARARETFICLRGGIVYRCPRANRLASNSLSEAIVYGSRIVERIKSLPEPSGDPLHVSFHLGRKDAPSQAMVENA